MNRFLVRMELHKKLNKTVTEADYKLLHEEMAKKSFYPTVTFDKEKFQLPTGTYRKLSDLMIDEVYKEIIDAGNSTIKKSIDIESFSFFLVEDTNSLKYNLKKV